MPKSLGQIHTANWTLSDITGTSDRGAVAPATNNIGILDCASKLTDQLQHMVRTGNIFKIVGIDITLEDYGAGIGGGQMSGRLEYYAPTKGRCAAMRNAWDFQKRNLRNNGIDYWKNHNYDFRPVLSNPAYYNGIDGAEIIAGVGPSDFPNLATIGGNPFVIGLGDTSNQQIFEVWNESLYPQGGTGNTFSEGFNDGLRSGEDFVLYEETTLQSPDGYADLSMQFIPFQLSWDPSGTDISVSLEWRPDPALYLSVLAGQFQLIVEELEFDGATAAVTMRIAIHVAGWKSCMSSGKKKRRSRKASSSKKKKGGKR